MTAVSCWWPSLILRVEAKVSKKVPSYPDACELVAFPEKCVVLLVAFLESARLSDLSSLAWAACHAVSFSLELD